MVEDDQMATVILSQADHRVAEAAKSDGCSAMRMLSSTYDGEVQHPQQLAAIYKLKPTFTA